MSQPNDLFFSVWVSVYQIFLKLRTPAPYFFKSHVSRLRTGMCHEEAALFIVVNQNALVECVQDPGQRHPAYLETSYSCVRQDAFLYSS